MKYRFDPLRTRLDAPKNTSTAPGNTSTLEAPPPGDDIVAAFTVVGRIISRLYTRVAQLEKRVDELAARH